MDDIRLLNQDDAKGVYDIVVSRDKIQLRPLLDGAHITIAQKIVDQLLSRERVFFGAFREGKMVAFRTFYPWPNNEDVTMADVYTLRGVEFERDDNGRVKIIYLMCEEALKYFYMRHVKRYWGPYTTDPRWVSPDLVPESTFLRRPDRYIIDYKAYFVRGVTHEVLDPRTMKVDPLMDALRYEILGRGSQQEHDQYVYIIHLLDPKPWPPMGPTSNSTNMPVPDRTRTTFEFPDINNLKG